MSRIIATEIQLKAEFFDIDSMQIVWHGNYLKFYERARWALMDLIDYGYQAMVDSGYGWPIVSAQLKYVRPLRMDQDFIVEAKLIEWEHRMRISYVLTDLNRRTVFHRGETIQMAVKHLEGTGLFISPPCFIQKLEAYWEMNPQHA